MAVIRPTEDVHITIDLGFSDSLEVGPDITVDAVVGRGSRQVVDIFGKVLTDGDAIALTGNIQTTTGAGVYVEKTGSVTSSNGNAVTIYGVSARLQNDGLIHAGNGNGVVLNGLDTSGTSSSVYNTGTIEASNIAVARIGKGNETLFFENWGTIDGRHGAFGYAGTGGDALAVDHIVNGGTMIGDVFLGAGDDIFDSRIGTVIGNIYGGRGDDVFMGSRGDDHMFGGQGNDILNAGEGADSMDGGSGNDIFFVDNAGDLVFEARNQGTDRIRTSIDYTLAADVFVEILSTVSTLRQTPLKLTGNGFNQTIEGNNGANSLRGMAGKDTLIGFGGADKLYGGVGNDTLTGGTGDDRFVFDRNLNATENVDTITDFGTVSGDNDLIVLDHAIFLGLDTGTLKDANFKANATGLATQSDDHIVYSTTTGNLYYDSNGNDAGGRTLFATLTGHPALSAADFLVY